METFIEDTDEMEESDSDLLILNDPKPKNDKHEISDHESDEIKTDEVDGDNLDAPPPPALKSTVTQRRNPANPRKKRRGSRTNYYVVPWPKNKRKPAIQENKLNFIKEYPSNSNSSIRRQEKHQIRKKPFNFGAIALPSKRKPQPRRAIQLQKNDEPQHCDRQFGRKMKELELDPTRGIKEEFAIHGSQVALTKSRYSDIPAFDAIKIDEETGQVLLSYCEKQKYDDFLTRKVCKWNMCTTHVRGIVDIWLKENDLSHKKIKNAVIPCWATVLELGMIVNGLTPLQSQKLAAGISIGDPYGVRGVKQAVVAASGRGRGTVSGRGRGTVSGRGRGTVSGRGRGRGAPLRKKKQSVQGGGSSMLFFCDKNHKQRCNHTIDAMNAMKKKKKRKQHKYDSARCNAFTWQGEELNRFDDVWNEEDPEDPSGDNLARLVDIYQRKDEVQDILQKWMRSRLVSLKSKGGKDSVSSYPVPKHNVYYLSHWVITANMVFDLALGYNVDWSSEGLASAAVNQRIAQVFNIIIEKLEIKTYERITKRMSEQTWKAISSGAGYQIDKTHSFNVLLATLQSKVHNKLHANPVYKDDYNRLTLNAATKKINEIKRRNAKVDNVDTALTSIQTNIAQMVELEKLKMANAANNSNSNSNNLNINDTAGLLSICQLFENEIILK